MPAVEPVATGRTLCGLRLHTAIYGFTLKFGEPSAWNGLYEGVRTVEDPGEFRKQLRMHFFTVASNVF